MQKIIIQKIFKKEETRAIDFYLIKRIEYIGTLSSYIILRFKSERLRCMHIDSYICFEI
jgi:hypothetical protein